MNADCDDCPMGIIQTIAQELRVADTGGADTTLHGSIFADLLGPHSVILTHRDYIKQHHQVCMYNSFMMLDCIEVLDLQYLHVNENT